MDHSPRTLTVLAFGIALSANAQSVTNGSCTGTVGNSMLQFLAGWQACALPPNNSPDVCDMGTPSWIGMVTVPAAPSPDGGAWIGLANGVNPVEQECAIGEMTGLVAGNAYRLSFWGACFGTGVGNYANGTPVILTVTVGATEQEFSIPMVAQEWNLYSVCFEATGSTMNFTLQTFEGGGYGSFDGFAVQPGAGAVDLLPDATLCPGATLLLDASLPDASYLWQNGDTTATFLVDAPGTYWVTITTPCGPATDTIEVSGITTDALDLGPDRALCPGGSLVLEANVAGNSYQWQNNSTAPTFTVTQPGTYWVIVGTDCGDLSDSVVVTTAAPPAVDLGPDDVFCNGEVRLLNATTAGAEYLWQDGANTPTYAVTVAGTYWVDVSLNGCTASDTIQLGTADCALEVVMPNVFSPNGDGINDIFLPAVIRGVTSSELTIYNRWGQRVFLNDDLMQGWNGRVEGTPCPDGTYFWVARYRGSRTDWQEQSGYVSVVR